jgi:hypothetical protein
MDAACSGWSPMVLFLLAVIKFRVMLTNGFISTIFITVTHQYCPQIKSWSPQGMRALRQYKVPRTEVMFVTIHREKFALQRKKWTSLLRCLNCIIFAVRPWITTSLYRRPIGSLPSTWMLCNPLPHCTKDVYTPLESTRDQLTVSWFLFL